MTAEAVPGEIQESTPSPVGCKHYRRRCFIVAPCCGETFWCHRCHNSVKNVAGTCDAHEIDRFQISEIICHHCNAKQHPGNSCIECGEVFGAYFCGKCNLWDDDGAQKDTFHCDKCGICRVGGRENFFHCDTCGSCYPNEIRNSHVCIENAMHRNCPICLQDLFHSTAQVTILQCGHTIHHDCLRELQVSRAGLQSLRCPICSLSLYEYNDLWAEMDKQVEGTPMPEEYQDALCEIICNDCQEPALVQFHILGHKCPKCSSYNTRRV